MTEIARVDPPSDQAGFVAIIDYGFQLIFVRLYAIRPDVKCKYCEGVVRAIPMVSVANPEQTSGYLQAQGQLRIAIASTLNMRSFSD